MERRHLERGERRPGEFHTKRTRALTFEESRESVFTITPPQPSSNAFFITCTTVPYCSHELDRIQGSKHTDEGPRRISLSN
jgi:hypothetical protein